MASSSTFPSPSAASKIAVGPAHSFVIGEGGQRIFGFGKNQNNVFLDEDALLKTSITELERLRPFEQGNAQPGDRIYQIASGSNHAVAIIKSKPDALGGRVLAWGLGLRGRLSHRDPASG
ncbi:unnamed protein product, partial [Amoebophrya sp. A25]|eukprot:GSA25T00004039001.1